MLRNDRTPNQKLLGRGSLGLEVINLSSPYIDFRTRSSWKLTSEGQTLLTMVLRINFFVGML